MVAGEIKPGQQDCIFIETILLYFLFVDIFSSYKLGVWWEVKIVFKNLYSRIQLRILLFVLSVPQIQRSNIGVKKSFSILILYVKRWSTTTVRIVLFLIWKIKKNVYWYNKKTLKYTQRLLNKQFFVCFFRFCFNQWSDIFFYSKNLI